jgi:Holliday junction resolvase RusA-like endonuclease
MEIRLVIPGPPMGKQVARVFPIKNRAGRIMGYRAANPSKTAKAMGDIRRIFMAAHPSFAPMIGLLELEMKAYCPIPKSMPKNLRELAEEEKLRQGKRPDLSNQIKLFEDAGNGVIFQDDARISRIVAEKWYSPRPRLEITVRALT